ncbi:MAG: hypothetical protein H6739_16130 [Alphaproteobacteria bacterium]|nr:hypothetical protein [Alphaproteobacteria bacterium]
MSEPEGSFEQIWINNYHGVAQDADGQATEWGSYTTYELYQIVRAGGLRDLAFPRVDREDWLYGCAIALDDTLLCWNEEDGVVDLGWSFPGRPMKVEIDMDHACVLDDQGVIDCVGSNGYGQLDVPE